jgi:drug/metabolite transporter (DMT)-like permease
VGALLALASSLAYGLSDVVGGLAARRLRPLLVALIGQVSGLAAMAVAVAVLPPAAPAPADLAWGAVSGLGTAAAMVYLFRGMARGAMSVVVPVSAVGGVALPVVVGVALLGERPSPIAWAGVALVLPSLWLVSRGAGDGAPTGPALCDGLASGVGIAVQYLGCWPAG